MKEILRFQPILKQTLWGGEKIIPFKGMDLALTNVGESWELSGVAGNETTVERTMSVLAMNSRYSLSSLMLERTCQYRCIPMTRRHAVRARPGARLRCGT